MSPEGTIVVDQLWKRFRADRSRALLKDRVIRSMDRVRGHSDASGWRYALRDVSFEVSPGEAVALIGANGSGKSTLLKILAKVMFPYAGSVTTSGRLAAMIEVAAGIHPELTGRENAFLYGTILGLSRADIAHRFDDIVAFAELEAAIDRPVKFYSSGMKVRLGFAVNAFLEPEILIVDEVLAVGDAAFQQRCLDRMSEVIASGTTLVYVSHDLHTVESMCSRVIWLQDGAVRAEGPTRDVLPVYRSVLSSGDAFGTTGDSDLYSPRVSVVGDGTAQATTSGGPITFQVTVGSTVSRRVNLVLGVTDGGPSPIFVIQRVVELNGPNTELIAEIASLPVAAGEYSVWTELAALDGGSGLGWHHSSTFKVAGPPLEPAPRGVVRPVPVQLHTDWKASP